MTIVPKYVLKTIWCHCFQQYIIYERTSKSLLPSPANSNLILNDIEYNNLNMFKLMFLYLKTTS